MNKHNNGPRQGWTMVALLLIRSRLLVHSHYGMFASFEADSLDLLRVWHHPEGEFASGQLADVCRAPTLSDFLEQIRGGRTRSLTCIEGSVNITTLKEPSLLAELPGGHLTTQFFADPRLGIREGERPYWRNGECPILAPSQRPAFVADYIEAAFRAAMA